MNKTLHSKPEGAESLMMCLPDGTVVRGCDLQTEPNPAAPAPSSPQLESHRSSRSPDQNEHTETKHLRTSGKSFKKLYIIC